MAQARTHLYLFTRICSLHICTHAHSSRIWKMHDWTAVPQWWILTRVLLAQIWDCGIIPALTICAPWPYRVYMKCGALTAVMHGKPSLQIQTKVWCVSAYTSCAWPGGHPTPPNLIPKPEKPHPLPLEKVTGQGAFRQGTNKNSLCLLNKIHILKTIGLSPF